MKQLFGILGVFLCLFISCDNPKKTTKVINIKDSIENSERIINTVNVTLISSAKKDLDDWQEYTILDEFLIKYYNISYYDALENAKELSGLVKNLKDSLRVDKINKKNVVARINTLENEALRLADMATITSISDDEVKMEVDKIVELFDALNSKINTIYKTEELQNSLDIDTEVPIEVEEERGVKFKKRMSAKPRLGSSKNKTINNEKD
ncbi:hypothetical protein R3X25_02795 [Lutibacter sp. TH_r2]|uniref:hypothetical protein n=1 Tax=Lutibacter sp. TH_r2 TaxID=3082083 RepID=UPI002955D4EA|nr:hypothetical protein [Lutibacter sp. TH_r2]MDV7186196.1 hypothetical protein [Lutibacter sp. TH_r2]